MKTMAKAIYVNLAVADLANSKAFFTGLGLSFNAQFTNDDAAALVIGDNIFAMLHTHDSFRRFTRKDIVNSHGATEVMLALEVESRASVDAMLDNAVRHGGRQFRDAQDHGFMYERAFEDPDGHVWEVFWMDASQHPGAQQP
jgi:predicted lactoylglutathione lyase